MFLVNMAAFFFRLADTQNTRARFILPEWGRATASRVALTRELPVRLTTDCHSSRPIASASVNLGPYVRESLETAQRTGRGRRMVPICGAVHPVDVLLVQAAWTQRY